MNGMKPMIAFAAFLWVAVMITYAAQAKSEQFKDGSALRRAKLMQASTSCSSSSSSSGNE